MSETTIFWEAAALRGGQRVAFLDSACGDDARLRSRVDLLLEAHENAGSFLRPPSELGLGAAATEGGLGSLGVGFRRPLIALLEALGFEGEQAEDLVADYLADLIARSEGRDGIGSPAEPLRIWFRSDLIRFVCNLDDKLTGDAGRDAAGSQGACSGWRRRAIDDPGVARTFEGQWALAVFRHGMDVLGEGYRQRGRSDAFESLKPFLAGDLDAGRLARVARELGIPEKDAEERIIRLRARYRGCLEQVVKETLPASESVSAEIAYLASVARQGATPE